MRKIKIMRKYKITEKSITIEKKKIVKLKWKNIVNKEK